MKLKLPLLPEFTMWESRKEVTPQVQEKRSLISGIGLQYGVLGAEQTTAISMQLSAVYAAVECISNALAALPFEPIRQLPNGTKEVDYTHSSYELLNIQPNKIQSRFTFIKTLVTNVLLQGNGYARIIRDNTGNPIELRLLNPYEVVMFISEDRSYTYYTHGKLKEPIPSEDMIHVLGFSYDGLRGVSVLSHAANATATATSADTQAKNFFNNGSNMSGIMQVNSALDDTQASEIKLGFRNALTSDGGGIMVIGGDMEFMPISVSSADAQLLETRKFSVLEIARFFGVSPVKLFDTSSTTYSNIENSQLAFLTDTVSIWCEKIENEFVRKFYRPSERVFLKPTFDVMALLRADMLTQSSYMAALFNVGGYTVNEVRKKVGNPVFENERANTPFVQSSMLPLDYDFTATNKQDNNTK